MKNVVRHLVLLSFLAISGCGGSSGPGHDLGGSHRFATGPITEHVKKLQSSPYLEVCDQVPELQKMQLEIAQAIDGRTDEIDRVAAGLPHRGFRRIELGPMHVLERETPASPRSGWRVYSYGWQKI